MPALSSTMTEGKIISWMKTEGDKLAKGESVVVVESDKADMDVESFMMGILLVSLYLKVVLHLLVLQLLFLLNLKMKFHLLNRKLRHPLLLLVQLLLLV